ncbi:MAG TPA: HAMP domain-containing sensor histidine kinase [Ktedonobacterales bacterium]|nr:HAMP domain-containing sensor histidine kinase [Ktedonobacterales bacterium]
MDRPKLSRRRPAAIKERTFLSDAAHELRTPLHSANGFVEMVLDGLAGSLTERQQELLGYAHVAISQLATLIEEILFLARADSGEFVPRLSAVDPTRILARAIESVSEHLRENNITLTQTISDMPPKIQADGERMREGLAGLLRGGLALVPSGGTIAVSAATHETMLRFYVALPDVRLDAEDMRHLFDRFYQARPLGADRSAQPGLGLAIARLTAGWHGGTARAESADDGSLILCYEFPISDS